MILHAVLHVAAIALVAWASPEAPLAAVSAAGGVSVLAAVAARGGFLRPWSDGLAWGAALVVLFTAGVPAPTAPALGAAALGLAGMVMALHVPPSQVPAPDRSAQAILLVVATGMVAVAAWLPRLLSQDQSIAVQDALAPTGTSVRIMGLVLVVAFLGLLPGLLRRLVADRRGR